MVVYLVLNVCETLLDSVKNYFKQDTRTNDEIKAKLFEMFEYNKAEFDKLNALYDDDVPSSVFDLVIYEHYEIEKLKKRKYGDSYEIKPCEYE